MADFSVAPQLGSREQHFRVPGPRQGLSLFLRFLPAAKPEFRRRRAVLYVHSATSHQRFRSRIDLMGTRGAMRWAKPALMFGG